ncbi:hypothetical protein EOT10_38870 [Streptomyces antnestii]|uniref:Uncharacterized protein n=1 Tax=Streptomyces antnestii TaxID=2494256 RepID=A0A437NZV4_9ACTN|nr:hypothetical protein [Streptomyces sp. San01]RVU15549.1 hypothetical protein EOT10_38870 [Streptomyces sp. San01]
MVDLADLLDEVMSAVYLDHTPAGDDGVLRESGAWDVPTWSTEDVVEEVCRAAVDFQLLGHMSEMLISEDWVQQDHQWPNQCDVCHLLARLA